MAVALGGAASLLVRGPLEIGWSVGTVTLGVYLDVVSVLLLGFVGLLGWVVATYAETNLRGREDLRATGGLLCGSLVALLVMVSSASVVTMAVAWTASGLAVTALVARSGTPRAAQSAALMRRHLLVGDVGLWAAIVLAQFTLPSLDRARLGEVTPGAATLVVAALLLVPCVTRTGLVPAHRWLAETAEAPSPISALLHAGVVNGAGVLVLLAWPIFEAAPQTLLALLVLGLASVCVGVWAGRARADVKGRLACSTTSQMGFMCVQLGLGLPAAALLHLLGHGAYKSWLFLRAGGAIGRSRRQVSVVGTPTGSRVAVAVVIALCVAVLVGSAAGVRLVDALGVSAIAPLALVTLAAALAAGAASKLARVSTVALLGAASSAGLVAGAYVWWMWGAEQLLVGSFPADRLWSTPVGLALTGLLLVAAVLVVLGQRHLETFPDSSLGILLLPTALSPAGRLDGSAVWPRVVGGSAGDRPHDAGSRQSPPPGLTPGVVTAAVQTAAATTGPAWPLRTLVAANPLARLEALPFHDAVQIARAARGTVSEIGPDYYLALRAAGRITEEDLAGAAAELGHTGALAASTDGSWDSPVRTTRRLCAALPDSHARRVTRLVDEHTGLWAQRCWSRVDPPAGRGDAPAGPWTRWRAAATNPAYERVTGIRGAATWTRSLPERPAEAIAAMSARVGLPSDALVGYLVALLVSGPGWASHAAWRARRDDDPAPLLELVAMRMAHDLLFAGAVQPSDRHLFDLGGSMVHHDEEGVVERVWQRALELGIERWLLPQLAESEPALEERTVSVRPTSQSVWCIDVRSERIRRHLEALGNHQTYGYAGFFGASARFIDADGNSFDQCPALIGTAFDVTAEPGPLSTRQLLHRSVTAVSAHPLGALVVAEAGGVFAALASWTTTVLPGTARRTHRNWVLAGADPELTTGLSADLSLRERVALAESALRTVGLIADFAPLILICGHGSTMENNAFAAAYDCGACGGNSGGVNARLLVQALNDPDVRRELAQGGIHLPEDTVAVAGLHDTTTDQVSLAGGLTSPTLVAMAHDLAVAGERTAQERSPLLPVSAAHPRRSVTARGVDWSEPTPEWGLAGNAAIVIGPRELTRQRFLDGRVFLHSYERDHDPEGSTLEVLLTAPLVVAQWINAQYYFSASAPGIFGAGDKTTHNVVGDVGVLTGAHGDLRVGLPWQSMFREDPDRGVSAASLVHEPVRLLAVVSADPDLVVRIVERAAQLRQLVSNEWIQLICLDRGQVLRLDQNLVWQPWSGSSARRLAPPSATL